MVLTHHDLPEAELTQANVPTANVSPEINLTYLINATISSNCSVLTHFLMSSQASLDFQNEILCSRSKRGKERPLFALLNPGLLHSLHFSQQPSLFMSPSNRNVVNESNIRDTLLPLVAGIETFEDRLHQPCAVFDFKKASTAMTTEFETRKQEETIHELLRIKLLETLVWALMMDGSAPIQQCVEKEESIDPSIEASSEQERQSVALASQEPPISKANTQKVFDLETMRKTAITEWKSTMKSFIEDMLHEDDLDTEPFAEKDDFVTSSLFNLLENESSKRNASTSLLNMVSAALGLRALTEVCLQVLILISQFPPI